MKSLPRMFVIGCVALSAMALARSSNETDLRATLAGMGRGQAEFKTDTERTGTRTEVDVQADRLAGNASYSITIGANTPFVATTDHNGSLSFDQRFTTNPPVANAGDSVTIADANATIVLSGTLQVHH